MRLRWLSQEFSHLLVTVLKIIGSILLGFLFAYLYGFIEHGFIPPAEHLRLLYFNHFAKYHIIMFGVFSALPLSILVYQPNFIGLFTSFGLWAYLPLGEDIAWYHFAGTKPAPEDWTSWGGGYNIAGRWLPKWYLTNSIVAAVFLGLALTLAILK